MILLKKLLIDNPNTPKNEIIIFNNLTLYTYSLESLKYLTIYIIFVTYFKYNVPINIIY